MLAHINLLGRAITSFYLSGANINSDIGFIGVLLFHIAGTGHMLTGVLLGISVANAGDFLRSPDAGSIRSGRDVAGHLPAGWATREP